jgi:hypothetical protein
MCAVNDGNTFFRPLVKNDLTAILSAYPKISKKLIQDLHAAMTDSNTVRPAVLVVLLEAINRLEKSLFGNSSHGATFAYSALQIKDGGDGKIFHRFQDPIMAHVHDAMLQFALAERNMRLTQNVLKSYGYDLFHFCDCGAHVSVAGSKYMESAEYKAINMVRSYGESIGAPVHTVSTIEEIPLQFTDMHQHEVDAYKQVWEILNKLPNEIFDQEAMLSHAFAHMTNPKQKGKPSEESLGSGSAYAMGNSVQVASYAA